MRCRSSSLVFPSARGLGGGWSAALLGLLTVGALTVPAQASAAPTTPRPHADEAPLEPTLVGEAELGIFAESRPDQDVASISPQVHLGMRPRDTVELDLRFGAVSVFRNSAEGREQEARPSNLSFGVHRVLDSRQGSWRYAKIGFAFVLPTAYATTPSEQEAYDYALGGRSGWDPWTWTPQTFGLVLPAAVRAQAGRRWVIGGDAGLAGLLPSADSTNGLAVAAQIAAQARVVTRRLGLGLRMSAVWNGRHPEDRSQAAASPFIDTALCRRGSGRRLRGELAGTSNDCPVHASARLNVNLDGPYGWSGRDAMRLWGVQVALGWSVF